MPPSSQTIQIKGLHELRRDLKKLGPASSRQLSGALREGVTIAARTASLLAPRKTGALASKYKPFARGDVAGIRNPTIYAGVHEYGGTIHPRNTIEIQRSMPITRAIAREQENMRDAIGDGIMEAGRRNGWDE